MVKLRFVIRDGKLVLRISEGKERFYRSAHHLLVGSPLIPKHWDDGKERFTRCASCYKENNTALQGFKQEFVKMALLHPDWNAKQIAGHSDPQEPAPTAPKLTECATISVFLEKVIAREKAKQGCNYEIYDKFLKKGRKLIPGFDTLTFKQINYDKCVDIAGIFAQYPGYYHTMKAFRNTLGKAAKDRNVPFKIWQIETFKFQDFDPNKNIAIFHKPDVLTPEQVTAFMQLNPSTITPSCRNRERVALFYDFCVMMLHTMMAPCDVAKLKPRDITGNNTFLIKRKKTHKPLEIPITPAVMRIIEKYKGMSPFGYILPIIDDKGDARQGIRDYSFKKFRQILNVWLKMIGKELGVPFDLYAYVFRHTAITLALDGGLPISYVASIAGTSIDMIQKHYYNADNARNAEKFQANIGLFGT